MKNGLYSIHVNLGDGRTGKGSGVLVLKDGRILGGDSFLGYVGSYEVVGEQVRGEVVVDQHTPSTSQFPLFGGRQVGIGFTGTESNGRILLDGTALVGRESMIFQASLMFLAGFEDTGKAEG